MDKDKIREVVRERYGQQAIENSGCYVPKSASSCCSSSDDVSREIGYTEEELKSIPEDANLGLGCGNPTAFASLKEGETVMDLGSGAGIDCFLAANKVGKTGLVIGVDMTPEMISKAKSNAEKTGVENVEFRLGEIENLPAADSSVDVIISNCVINLSPEKQKVFNEAFRVLKPGGRVMVSDIVLEKELPEKIRNNISAYVGCISGASLKEEYIEHIRAAGFEDIEIIEENPAACGTMENDPLIAEAVKYLGITPEEVSDLASKTVKSAKIKAVKPL